MTRPDDSLGAVRGLLNGLAICLPLWAAILVGAFNLIRAAQHFERWAWIVR